jgi:phytoene desaturase (3,4-didehydrolycopene-forming)
MSIAPLTSLIVLFVMCLGYARLVSSLSTSANDLDIHEKSRDVSRVVVVGGGVGGLAVAARIASASSSQVIVLEKNSVLGGRCGSFHVETKLGRFRHERGPSLLLLKQVYQDLFQDCSRKNSESYGLEMRQCIPAYQVVFDDGDAIELGFPAGVSECEEAEEACRSKMDAYETSGSRKWDEYLACTAAFLDCGLPNFIEERLDLPSFPAFLRESLRDRFKSWPLKPHSDVLDATFKSNKMRALASFQNLYVGLEPYRNDAFFGGGVLRTTAPAVFGLLAAIELHPSNKNAGGTCRIAVMCV